VNAPARLKSVPRDVAALPVTLRCRIRTHLTQLEELKRQTTEVEAALSADARRFADEHGLTVKPTIPQLRHMIGGDA
jgi:hypothetical protein